MKINYKHIKFQRHKLQSPHTGFDINVGLENTHCIILLIYMTTINCTVSEKGTNMCVSAYNLSKL